MEPEKLLPEGEPGIEVTALPVLKSKTPEETLIIESDIASTPEASTLSGVPSAQAQSWGTVISIFVIVLMIVIGAFYAWGQRIAQNRVFTTPTEMSQ